jgi:hypothetical protein
MNQQDEEKTSFITPFGTYCFRRMIEGLRNAGSTFARMTAEVFKDNKTISAYVDNIVVQSKLKADHINDLTRAFSNLRAAGLKLNPDKCIFGVSKGKLPGCLVSARGTEANQRKYTQYLTWSHQPQEKWHKDSLAGSQLLTDSFQGQQSEGYPSSRY